LIKSDKPYLENELGDIARLFFARDDDVQIFARTQTDGERLSGEITVRAGGKVLSCAYSEKDKLLSQGGFIPRRLEKRAAKAALYQLLSRGFPVSLPYGALTGIRPSKLLRQIRAERSNADEYMTDYLCVSPEKLRLLGDIEREQSPYIAQGEGRCALYVNVPFCRGRCSYCSFVSCDITKAGGQLAGDYVRALVSEIAHARALIAREGLSVGSIYVGGGTPSSLELCQIQTLLEAIGSPGGAEYTFEAGRPDSITPQLLELLKSGGVSRISVNPQTMHADTLKAIGRAHTPEDFIRAYELSKKYGFLINTDLIMGLEGEDAEMFAQSLGGVIALGPDNVTVHALALKSGSRLKEQSVRRPDAPQAEHMSGHAYRTLTAAGYSPYYTYRQKYSAGNLENTGYCTPGNACLYNMDNMEELCSVIACGANAITKRVSRGGELITRSANPKDIPTYIEKLDACMEKKRALFEQGD